MECVELLRHPFNTFILKAIGHSLSFVLSKGGNRKDTLATHFFFNNLYESRNDIESAIVESYQKVQFIN